MSQTKETGRAARQGPPPRGQPISFRGRRAPSKHSPTSPQLSPLFSGISAQSASMIPNPPVPKIRSSRPPAPQSGPLGTSPREAPSSRRPALGALRKGRVGSGPASPSVPGRRHLDPAGGQVPETDPRMPVPAARHCTCGDRAAWRRWRRGCRRGQAPGSGSLRSPRRPAPRPSRPPAPRSHPRPREAAAAGGSAAGAGGDGLMVRPRGPFHKCALRPRLGTDCCPGGRHRSRALKSGLRAPLTSHPGLTKAPNLSGQPGAAHA